jgi:prepilin-type processing-associated H-X9-DG protein
MPEHRSRFTLIDLALVLGILCIALGLIVPAIQRVREKANRTACAANLRRLGLGAQSFHEAHLHFPAGRFIDAAVATSGVNSILHDYFKAVPQDHTGLSLIVDFVVDPHHHSLFELCHRRIPKISGGFAPGGWYYFPGMDPALTTQPDFYRYIHIIESQHLVLFCPSNRIEGAVDITIPWIALGFPVKQAPFPGATDYAMCKGTNAYLDRFPWRTTDATAKVQEVPKRARGIFDTNSNTCLADITDGLSNTFLFGEVAGRNRHFLARANYADNRPSLDSQGRPVMIDQAWGVPAIENAAVAVGLNSYFGSYLAVTAQYGGYDTSGTGPGNPIDGPEPLNAPLVMASIDWSGAPAPSKDPWDTYNNPALLSKGMHLDTLNGFRSMHPGGANFCFADGTVRFIATPISQYIYEAMSTYQGGEVMENEGSSDAKTG